MACTGHCRSASRLTRLAALLTTSSPVWPWTGQPLVVLPISDSPTITTRISTALPPPVSSMLGSSPRPTGVQLEQSRAVGWTDETGLAGQHKPGKNGGGLYLDLHSTGR